MHGVNLPDDIAERCIRLARELGLISAGVDLRRTPAGQYFCFEVNTRPAFSFYEQHTGQRIADGLIDALIG
jgi:glutathione synthase/RimK-type ligase-like ATP-grasp enzyme